VFGFGGFTEESSFVGNASVVTLPISLRWNPMRGDQSKRPTKPYLTVGAGPVFGAFTGFRNGGYVAAASNESTIEAHVGAGMDFHVARSWSIGFVATRTWMGDFAQHRNYGGFEIGVNIGVLFGRGHGAR
jgi:outer membrane protein W